jgi:hypothetical protein
MTKASRTLCCLLSQIDAAYQSLYAIINRQIVNRATSIVSLTSQLWTNIFDVVNEDLMITSAFLINIKQLYTDNLRYAVDSLSSQFLTLSDAMAVFESIAARVIAANRSISREESNRLDYTKVSITVFISVNWIARPSWEVMLLCSTTVPSSLSNNFFL